MDEKQIVGAPTSLSNFCDRLIEAGWLVIAAAIPLFFNFYTNRVFEPDKLTLFRAIVLIMALAAIVSAIEKLPGKFASYESVLRFIKGNSLNLPVLVFGSIYILTSILSVSPSISFWGSYVRMQGAVTNIGFIIFFFLVAQHLRTKAQLDRLFNVIILTSLPISLFAILQHLNMDPLPWAEDVTNRVTSTMGNAIFLAAYLIMVVPLTLIRLFDTTKAWLRSKRNVDLLAPAFLLPLAYAVLLIIQLAAIIFTKSRGPWLGLAAGLAVLALFWASTRPNRRSVLLVASGAFVLVLFLVLLNLPSSPIAGAKSLSPYVERMGSLLDLESGSNKVRMLIWSGDDIGGGMVGMVTADPLRSLIGYGPETIYLRFDRFYPPELAHYQEGVVDRSHNDYLDSIATMGVIGLLAQLAVITAFLVMSIRRFRRSQSQSERVLLAGLVSAVSAHAIEAFFGIGIAATRTYFWLYLAVGLASIQIFHMTAEPEVAPVTRKASTPSRNMAKKAGKLKRRKSREPKWQPLAIYLVLTLISLPVLVATSAVLRIDSPPLIVGLGVVWLLLGLYVTADWLKNSEVSVRQATRLPWWTYLPAVSVGVLLLSYLVSGVVADTYFKVGQAYHRAKIYDMAVPNYLRAIDWAPREDFYYLSLGVAYLEVAKTMGGQKPAANAPDNTQRETNLEQLFNAGDKAFSEAEKINPLNTEGLLYLARLYASWGELTSEPEARQDRLKRAVDRYKRAIDLSPNRPLLYDELALSYHLLKEEEESQANFQTALKLDDKYPLTYSYMGNVLKDQGQLEQAEKMYEKAVALDIRFVADVIGLADAYAIQGNNERAEALYLKAIALDESSIRGHSSLAYHYYKQRKLEAALSENLKVLELAPNDLVSRTNLVLLYKEMGQKERALAEAKLALSMATPEQQPRIKTLMAELEAMGP